jgi:NADH-quinone oxidoreductase subunit E
MAITDVTRSELRELMSRYPEPRSALLPMLHLVQSVEGYVTQDGIDVCAQEVGLTTAEVSAVASFYTMFKRYPVGKHHVGVCVNSLCALKGGDAIWQRVSSELGVGHDETSADGQITLERIECQAACTHAPVMTVNWEFMDDMDEVKASKLISDLRSDVEVKSTRGPKVRTFKEVSRTIAGFDDGLVDEPGIDEAMLAGLKAAKQANN